MNNKSSSIEVSEEMIDAGQRAWTDAGGHYCDSADLVGPIYLAMKAKDQSLTLGDERPANDEDFDRVTRMVEGMKRHRAMGGDDQGLIKSIEHVLILASASLVRSKPDDVREARLREAQHELMTALQPRQSEVERTVCINRAFEKIDAALSSIDGGK